MEGGEEVAEPVCNSIKELKESYQRVVNDSRSTIRMACVSKDMKFWCKKIEQ